MRLGDEVLGLVHADPAAARLHGLAVVPAVRVRDAMRGSRIFREERRQPDADVRRSDLAEVADRVVVQSRFRDSNGLALCRIRERQVERLAGVRRELGRICELGNGLLAAERRAACAVEPAPGGLRQGDVRPFIRHDAGALQFEAIRHAVFAGDDADGEVAEVGDLLLATQINRVLLVDRSRDSLCGACTANDLARRRAPAKPFPVDADSYLRLRDERLPAPQNLVRKRIRVEAQGILAADNLCYGVPRTRTGRQQQSRHRRFHLADAHLLFSLFSVLH